MRGRSGLGEGIASRAGVGHRIRSRLRRFQVRDNRGRFAPGASGNPGGRTRYEADAIEACEAALADSIDRLIELRDSEDENIALKAIAMITDRALGRPQQRKDVNIDGTVRHEMTIGDAYIDALKAVNKRAEEREAREEAEAKAAQAKIIEHRPATRVVMLNGEPVTVDGEPEPS